MTIATHQNQKSGAQVTVLREYHGDVQIRDGQKLRWIEKGKFARDYEPLSDEPQATPTPRVLAQPAIYAPRVMDETALARQRLAVRGSIRSKLTKDDRDQMAAVGAIPYCCLCGSTRNLQVSHAPSGLFGKAFGEKGHPALLARLCSIDPTSCHEQIDKHTDPDWRARWMEAALRTQAAVYDMRSAA